MESSVESSIARRRRRTLARRHDPTSRGDPSVLATLEPEQLVQARRRYGRRRLMGWAFVAMWGLRIYALLMLLVVVFRIATAVHGGN